MSRREDEQRRSMRAELAGRCEQDRGVAAEKQKIIQEERRGRVGLVPSSSASKRIFFSANSSPVFLSLAL
jgi:hypothetical protein